MKDKKKEKRTTLYFQGIPLTLDTLFKALYIIAIIVAICILTDIVANINNIWLSGSLLFLCFCAWHYHTVKLSDKKNLYEKVAWIAEKASAQKHSYVSLRDFELVEYIEFEQNKQSLPLQFRIDFSNEEEKSNLIKVLNSHKEHVVKYYFSDWLAEAKDIYRLNSLEYYFFSLHCFVNDNLRTYKVSEAYCNREYISDWQFKCQLTDYGRTYYKLYLITQLYVEGNEHVQKLYEYIDKERKNTIMETLENNEVVFLQHQV